MNLSHAILGALLAASALGTAGNALAIDDLHKKHACTACHADDRKLVGPSYKDVAEKYAKDKDAVQKLSAKIRKGGSGVWGPVPMPPNASASDAEVAQMVKAVLSLAKPAAGGKK